MIIDYVLFELSISLKILYFVTCYQTASQRCSVLLVDRTLDLCGPTSHQTDCLADRILGVLNHLTQSSSDVCVDMSPIAPPYGGTSDVEVGGCVVNGCLAQPGDRRARQLLQTLICSKQKVYVLCEEKTVLIILYVLQLLW